MGRVTVIFLVVCLIAAVLDESDAWRRRRRRPPLHNRLIAQESDQTYGEEMKKEKGISLEENMDIEPGTEFQDQENENYYLDHEI